MARWATIIFVFLLLSAAPVIALAQECTTFVQQALTAAKTNCETTGRNQACYGNIRLEATPQDDASDFQFETSGDKVDVASIASLRMAAFNADTSDWGVAMMQVQANIPDSSPENVTILLFGDVELENKSNLVTLDAQTTDEVDVRSTPKETAPVLTSLPSDTPVIATGRTSDGQWIRIKTDAPNSGSGWLAQSVLESDGDWDTLATVKANDKPYGPMQAFTFRSGFDTTVCEKAQDGIMVQTPQGVGEISLLVNEVNIQLGSTVYMAAQPDNVLVVATIEGKATLTAFGVTQVVPAGSIGTVPLDADGVASAPPNSPAKWDSCNPQDLQALPLELLPRQIPLTCIPATTPGTATQSGTGGNDNGSDTGAVEQGGDNGSTNVNNSPVCGNNVCEAGEDASTCPADCPAAAAPVCGNGICEGEESVSQSPNFCAADCMPADTQQDNTQQQQNGLGLPGG